MKNELNPLSGWQSQAACRGLEDVFFPEEDGKEDWEIGADKMAKSVCWRCSVRSECLSDTLNLLIEERAAKSSKAVIVTVGTFGGTNRWEREQMLAAAPEWWAELDDIAAEHRPAAAQALREVWESVGPSADDLRRLSDEDVASKWGTSPAVAAEWRKKHRLRKASHRHLWKQQLVEEILAQLDSRKARERAEVREAVESLVPDEEVKLCQQRRQDLLYTSSQRARTKILNDVIYTMARRGDIRTFKRADGKEMLVRC